MSDSRIYLRAAIVCWTGEDGKQDGVTAAVTPDDRVIFCYHGMAVERIDAIPGKFREGRVVFYPDADRALNDWLD